MKLIKLTCYDDTHLPEDDWHEYPIILNIKNIDWIHPSDDCENCSIIKTRNDLFMIKVPFSEAIEYLEAEYMKQQQY